MTQEGNIEHQNREEEFVGTSVPTGLRYLQTFRDNISKKYAMLAKLNLPNKITLLRILLIPLLVVFLIRPSATSSLIAALIFSAASFTDWLDGHLARTTQQITTLGKLLDPVVDKILISAALIPLVAQDRVAAWIVILILGREFAVMGLRSIAAAHGMVIPAGSLGKYKMVLEIAAVIPLILNYNLLLNHLGTFFLYIAVSVSLISGTDYFLKFWREEKGKMI